MTNRNLVQTMIDLTHPEKGFAPAEIDRILRERFPGVTEHVLHAAWLEGIAQLQNNADAAEREAEQLQRFGDEVHAIAAETGIVMHPKTPFGRVLEIAASRGNSRAAALLRTVRLEAKLYPRAPR